MRAEIVSVGTELLLGQTVDTNAAYLARALSGLGVTVHRRVTIGDNHDRLLATLSAALDANDMVIAIGGLGPTMDDITRETLAEAMGDTLRFDEAIAEGLRGFFAKRGLQVLQSNLKQAMVPTAGRAIDNPNGTAPGVLFEKGGKVAIALPGPPNEFIPMVDNEVTPYLRGKVGTRTLRSVVIRVCGMGESVVEDKLKDLMQGTSPTVAPYAKTGEVHLRVSALADDAATADAIVAPMVEEIRRRLGEHAYAFNDEPLETAVVRLLAEHRLTLATAESCTGGQLAGRITDIAGSSDVFLGGAVVYSNTAKTGMAGVPPELIAEKGAVSPEVAVRLATGIRERFGADLGIGITGIAGPGGGTETKPVGLVYVAMAHAGGVQVETCNFIGIRADVRRRATQTALTLLRDHCLKAAAEPMTDG